METGTITYEQMLEILRTILQPTVLLAVAGILLSVIASYIPGLNEWWAGQGAKFKPLCMLGAVTLLTIVVGVLSFTNVVAIVPATKEGLLLLIFDWIVAAASNQTAYKLSPATAAVQAIKDAQAVPKDPPMVG